MNFKKYKNSLVNLYCNFKYFFIWQRFAKHTKIVILVFVRSLISKSGLYLKNKINMKEMLLNSQKKVESRYNQEPKLDFVKVHWKDVWVHQRYRKNSLKKTVQTVKFFLPVTKLKHTKLEKSQNSGLSWIQLKPCSSDQIVLTKFNYLLFTKN